MQIPVCILIVGVSLAVVTWKNGVSSHAPMFELSVSCCIQAFCALVWLVQLVSSVAVSFPVLALKAWILLINTFQFLETGFLSHNLYPVLVDPGLYFQP